MPENPPASLAHLGAAVDALIASNALLFSMLASPKDVEAATALLEQLAASPLQSPEDGLRMDIFGETARQLRALQSSGILPRRTELESSS
ncbi:hypothetical protein I5U36_01930 [Stenotrophomonas maltophilia]|uniref:hypothetical protein n=1 Tax=Stenotrophomonas TaxID=40323 RepID=UPI00128EBE78|nr:hypothetical protein [Stenotrophomonas pavanii]MBH1366940.1 hypothetical protein [Stenotrophomonas maltophilia]MBH1434755.1 hypothetical protein [Stenotrophomonas maltophilia]